jgi:arylsulfatase A-like enzyme
MGMDFRKQKASVDRLHLHRAGLGALLGLAGLQIPESCEAAGASVDRKFNILFIIADDLGVKDLGCTGSTFYETPNIDRIARSGMTFTQGYATCPVCSPSRASIITGKYTPRHGITDWIGSPTGWNYWRVPADLDLAALKEYMRNPVKWNVPRLEAAAKMANHAMLPPDFVQQLPAEEITIAEALKGDGYKTFFAGKWHLGFKPEDRPEKHGFDINKGGHGAGMPSNFFSPYKNPALENGPDGEMLDMRLARETAKFIELNKDERFFAFLSFYSVHTPIQCSREKWLKYRDKAMAMGNPDRERYVSDGGFNDRAVQDHAVYAGLVEHMDDAVGIVLDKLKALGLEKNTIIIFTSDNGGVSQSPNWAFTSNRPYRGGKGCAYEGGVREPYFISVPGVTKPGSRCDVPVTGTDFYPTLLELAGAPLNPQQHVDGVSLVPLLKGATIAQRDLFWHFPHYNGYSSGPASWVRSGDWKLIHFWDDGRDELYHLGSDIGERTNRVNLDPVKAAELRDRLCHWLMQVNAKVPAPNPFFDKEKTDRLWAETYAARKQVAEEAGRDVLRRDYAPVPGAWGPWWGSRANE